MSSYLFRAYIHRHMRGSTPSIVLSPRELRSSKHYVGWSPTNTTIATSTSNNTYWWDSSTGKVIHQWEKEVQIAWSPDGNSVLMLCSIYKNGKAQLERALKIRDAHTGEVVCNYESTCGDFIYDIAWSPDSTRIAHFSRYPKDGQVYIWNARTGKILIVSGPPLLLVPGCLLRSSRYIMRTTIFLNKTRSIETHRFG